MAKASTYARDFNKGQVDVAAENEDFPTNLPTIRNLANDDPDGFEGVSNLLDELREGGEYGELSVYGRPKQQPGQPTQRGNAFLMVCGANDYSLAELMSLIQESWGEGLYTIRGKRGGKYAGQKTIPIGPAPVKPGQTQNVAQAAPVDTTKQLGELFEKMARQQTETMAAMLGSVLAKIDRPAVDPMALQRDTIAMLASMRDVFTPPQQPVAAQTSAGSTFSQLRELLEIKDLLSREAPGVDTNPLMDMAKTFLPTLMASAQAAQTTQAQPVKQLPAATRPNPAKQPTTPNVQESPAMMKMLSGLKTLVEAAKRNADPDLYAELIVDQFDIEEIKTFLANDDAIDRLALFSVDVKNQRAWFEKLRAIMVQWLAEADAETETNDTPPEPTENKNDIAVNGDTTG